MRYPANATALTKNTAMLFAVLTIAVGMLAIYGLYTHTTQLFQILPDYIAMVFNTALNFTLTGIVIYIQLNNKYKFTGYFILAYVLCISILSLLQHLLTVNFGIDQFFFEHYSNTKTEHLGRMAPNTAVGFIMASIALILINTQVANDLYVKLSCFLGFIITSVAIIYITGYLFSLEALYQWGKLTPISPNTVLGFLFLGAGIFFHAWHICQIKKIDILSIIPSLIAVTLLLISYLYWQALVVYQTVNQAPTILSDVALYLGLLISVFVGSTLSYGILASRRAKSLQLEIEKNKKSLSFIKATLDSTADGILFVNNNGNATLYNKKFLEILQIREEELNTTGEHDILKILFDKAIDNDNLVDKFKIMRNVKPGNFYEITLKNGKEIECSAIAQYIDGKIVGHCWSFRDVTNAKENATTNISSNYT